jgi:hypothetical protein
MLDRTIRFRELVIVTYIFDITYISIQISARPVRLFRSVAEAAGSAPLRAARRAAALTLGLHAAADVDIGGEGEGGMGVGLVGVDGPGSSRSDADAAAVHTSSSAASVLRAVKTRMQVRLL